MIERDQRFIRKEDDTISRLTRKKIMWSIIGENITASNTIEKTSEEIVDSDLIALNVEKKIQKSIEYAQYTAQSFKMGRNCSSLWKLRVRIRKKIFSAVREIWSNCGISFL